MSSAKKTRIFMSDEAIARLRQAVHSKAVNFYSMYSSVLGGIVIDPSLMVLPLDDHMVHRGHAVFDTATLTHGMLYQLDPHLDRLLRSAELARTESTNYLPNVLVVLEAKDHGADNGVFIDQGGMVAESSNMNVALVTKDRVLRHPSFDAILSGITIQRVLQFAERLLEKGEL